MATNGHDEAPNSDVNPQSLKQGYEPDTINLRAILYVPAVLVICFIATYLIVTEIINHALPSPDAPSPNPMVAKRGRAPIDDRLARISSEPGATPEYKQPRLEGLNELELKKDEPAFVKSYQPTAKGNSPHYHPEDLRTTSELAKELGLQDYGWVNQQKGIVRLPVDQAVKVVLEAKDPKKPNEPYLPQKQVELSQLTQAGPKASNAQWNSNKSPKEPKELPHQSPKDGHP